MAIQQNVKVLDFNSAVDLSACQYHCVRLSGSFAVDLCHADHQVDGILVNKPSSGEVAQIQYGGIAKVVTGANILVNNQLQSNDSGHAIATTSSFSFGKALTAGTSGDIIEVLLQIGSVSGSMEA